MNKGFEKADSDNLPEVNNDMVMEYFINNANYMQAESRGEKSSRAAKSKYGDEAVGYVQLKREGNTCTIMCRITPEHKIKQKDYEVTAVIDEEEGVVISCLCKDCEASAGGCKHSVAFLLWIHRRSEEDAVTSKECYWKKSKLSGSGSSADGKTLAELLNEHIPKKEEYPGCLEQILIKSKNTGCLLATTLIEQTGPVENVSLYRLILKYKQNGNSADEFLSFCQNNITEEDILDILNNTIEQAKSPIWEEVRYGRITASVAYEVSRCKKLDGTLVQKIFGAVSPLHSDAVERGKHLENKVLDVLKKQQNISFKKCGIFLRKDLPILGASPDAVSAEYSVEIKCPAKDNTIKNYIQNGVPTKKCMAQIQLQMHMSGKKIALFCVASPDFETTSKIEVIKVKYDEEYCVNLVQIVEEFWKQAIFPHLYGK